VKVRVNLIGKHYKKVIIIIFTNKEVNEVKKFIASRRLSTTESLKNDPYSQSSWHMRQQIVPEQETPVASGFGYTQSPYTSPYNKLWGVQLHADLSKYRLMYRNVPVIKKAVDKLVATAVSKGFKFEGDEVVVEYLDSWIKQQQDFYTTINTMVSDAILYGTSFTEIVYEDSVFTEGVSTDPEFGRVELPDGDRLPEVNINGIPSIPNKIVNNNGKYISVEAKGNPVWLKPLDPLYVRIRSDSYGNVFGYLQYLSTPPVAFTPEKMLCIRYNPKSVMTENAYGTSMIQSLIRTQETIWTLENDLLNISHACTKPPLIFACGNEEDEPWTQAALSTFVSATGERGPGKDLYHRGDVKATPLPFPANSLLPLITYLNYHTEQRMMMLGIPPDLLGFKGGSNRSTAMVTFDDFINTIQIIQEQIGEALEEQLVKRIVAAKFGEDTEVPKIVWNEIYSKDESTTINTVTTLLTAGLITIDEGREKLSEVGFDLGKMPIQLPTPQENVKKVDEGEVNEYMKAGEDSASENSLMYPELIKKKGVK